MYSTLGDGPAPAPVRVCVAINSNVSSVAAVKLRKNWAKKSGRAAITEPERERERQTEKERVAEKERKRVSWSARALARAAPKTDTIPAAKSIRLELCLF